MRWDEAYVVQMPSSRTGVRVGAASMQQENLDTIEGAVTEANVRVVGGLKELLKAKKHQRTARKRVSETI